MKETESFLTAAQNKTIRTNYTKVKIDNMQKNSKFNFCGDLHEMINFIVSESCKLVQKEYKTRHNLVGKVIYWELYKKSKFNHSTKWYMHQPWSIIEKTYKIL